MNYYISNGNISNFQQLLGKFLPHSLQQFVLWPPFCLKSWNPGLTSLGNTKICWNIEQYLNYYILNRNISNFQNFWPNFCLIHSSCWFFDHFFAWNHGTQICFLCETQKYGEELNNTWMITFYIGILAILGKFGQIFASFTPLFTSQAAFLPEIIVGRYSPLG